MKSLNNRPTKTWFAAFAALCVLPLACPAHAAPSSTPSRPGISDPAGDEVGRLRREVEALRTQAAELRAAVDALREEVAQLHAQMNRAPSRLGGPSPNGRISSAVPLPPPGTPPTDEKVKTLLRRLIRNDAPAADVDRASEELTSYVGENMELRRQAHDAVALALQLSYGTPHAQDVMRRLEERYRPTGAARE